MKILIRVLIVEDSEEDTMLLLRELQRGGYEIISERVETREAMSAALKKPAWDIVISDYTMLQFSALDALRLLWESDLDIPFVIVSGTISEETAINALKAGASDYILKSNLKWLLPTIERELCEAEIRSERKKAEEALHESNKFNSSLLDNAPIPIIVTNPDTSIRYANPAFERLTGFCSPELLGQKAPYPWWLKEKQEQYIRDFQEITPNITNEFERLMQKKNGALFYVKVTSMPISGERGLKYCLENWIDITEHKQAEQEIQRSLLKVRKAIEGTIQTTAHIAEIRDPYTAGHQRRVAKLSVRIAEEMGGLRSEQLEGIQMTAFIHDIGKMGVPGEILSKPGRLTKAEFDIIKTHPQVGYDILNLIEFPWPIAQIVLQHHERLDGSGYPLGISGENILFEARILAVADVVEAIVSHRPYRPALSIDKALEEISQNNGTLYDSDVTEACTKLFSKGLFRFE